MESRNLECVVTDLDGSLLSKEKQIGARDLETIGKLKAKGIPVFIATGRHHSVTRDFIRQVGAEFPVITGNGAVLYDFATERPLWVRPLSKAVVSCLWRYCLEHQLRYYIYTDHKIYLNLKLKDPSLFKEELRRIQEERSDEFEVMGPNFDPTPFTVTKFMIPECIPPMRARLEKQEFVQQEGLQLAYSGTNFLDINSPEANKGNALQYLSQKYGFSLDNTIALGDNDNDLTMLRCVGMAAVPRSSHEQMHQPEFYLTEPNGSDPLTDTVAHFFPHLI